MVKPPFFCASPRSVQTLNTPGARGRSLAQQTGSSPEREARSKSETMSRVKKVISSPLAKRRQAAGLKRVFGVPLDDVMRDATPGEVVPRLVMEVCQFIEREGMDLEGIFRVSGNQKVVEKLKAEFDQRGEADLGKAQDVAAVASVLKQFLRELPVPLIPNELKPQFLAAYSTHQDSPAACADELAALVMHLPAAHYQLIKYIIRFLVKVSLNQSQNKMGVVALAIVFGPNFFQLSDGLAALKEQQFINGVLGVFIHFYDVIFKEPKEELLKSHLKSPPAKPLPFREHMKEKQKRQTHYGGIDEESENEGEMTVCGNGRDEHELLEETMPVLSKTLNERDLVSARERRRRTVKQRPLCDSPGKTVRPGVRTHQYEEVILTDDVSKEKTEEDEGRAERAMTDIYAVPNKTKVKKQTECKVIDITSTPSSGSLDSVSHLSHLKVVPAGNLSKANVDLFNVLSGSAKAADEDPLRTSSPWSVSSGGVSPMPLTPHSTLQLEDIVHATVTRHLFGHIGKDSTEHQSRDMHLKPRRARRAKPVDKGASLKDEQQADSITVQVADWEERIRRSKERVSLSPEVVCDNVSDLTNAGCRPKKRRPNSAAFDFFEQSNMMIHLRPPTPDSLKPDDFSEGKEKSSIPDKLPVIEQGGFSNAVVQSSSTSLELDLVQRNSETGMLTSLTSSRPAPPRNRRAPVWRGHPESSLVVTDLEETVASQEFITTQVSCNPQRPAIVLPLDLSQLTKHSKLTDPGKVKVSAWSSDDYDDGHPESLSKDMVRTEVQVFQPSPEIPRSDVTDGGEETHDVTPQRDHRHGDNGPGWRRKGARRKGARRSRHPVLDALREVPTIQSGKAIASTMVVEDIEQNVPIEQNIPREEGRNETGQPSQLETKLTGEGNSSSSSPFDGMSRKELAKAYCRLKLRIRDYEEEFEREHGRKPDLDDYGPMQEEQREFRLVRRKLKERKSEHEGRASHGESATTSIPLETVLEDKPSIGRQSDMLQKSPAGRDRTAVSCRVSPVNDEWIVSVDPELLAELNSDDRSRLDKLVNFMEKCDAEFREAHTRQGTPEDLASMTKNQLKSEKQTVQRALLSLERSLGRPKNLAEKEVTRPLYNRYRMVKQVLTDWEQSGVQDVPSMTATQMAEERQRLMRKHPDDENDQASPKELADSGIQVDQQSSVERLKSTASDALPPSSSVDTSALADSITSTHSVDVFTSVTSGDFIPPATELLAGASTEELERQLQEQTEKKKRLRQFLKVFEREFEGKHGRKVGREDRLGMETEYEQYKKAKSSMRRIERLLSERRATGTLTI